MTAPERLTPGAAGGTEATVARIWTELGLSPQSVNDDFFDLGGQSLTLVRFLARVQETYGLELPVDALFDEDLTVAAVARAIDRVQLSTVDDGELADALAELDGLSDEDLAALLARNE